MALTSVDGLVSGLDTTSIIGQLMQLERQPVVGLTSRKAVFDAQATAWGAIGSKIAALRTALEAVDTRSDFQAFKATSSNSNVLTASAGSTAVSGSLSFKVNRLAAAHQLTSQQFTGPDAVLGQGTFWAASGLGPIDATIEVEDGFKAGAHTLVVRDGTSGKEAVLDGVAVAITTDELTSVTSATFTVDGKALKVTFATADPPAGTATLSVANLADGDTVSTLASRISVSGGPARAQVVNFGGESGAYLVMTAGRTGAANSLEWNWSGAGTVTLGDNLGGDLGTLDAQVEVPNLGVATRASNTITDLIPGVTLNLVKEDPVNPVTVNVAADVDGAVAKVKAFVDALNGVVNSIKTNCSYDAASKKGGPLLGSSTARNMASSLATVVGKPLDRGAYTLLSQLGVNLTKDGTYTFDESKVRTALGNDFDGAVGAINSLAAPVLQWARDNDGTTGTVHHAQDGAKTTSSRIQDQIDRYDVRLAQTELRYRKQFTALEAALGQLKSQSNWLAGQLGSLPSFDSSQG